MHPEKPKTSPWVYVGLGCGALALVGAVAFGALAYWGIQKGKEIEAQMADPVVREQKARETLGAEALPPGYLPAFSMKIPYFMEMTMLSDQEPTNGRGDLGERGFFYIEMPGYAVDDREVEDFLEARVRGAGFLKRASIDVDPGEVLRRGTLEAGGMVVRYVARRGNFDFGASNAIAAAPDRADVTTTLVMDCPQGNNRVRMGIWFIRDPAPGDPTASLDLAGTPADEAALREFLGHFNPCG